MAYIYYFFLKEKNKIVKSGQDSHLILCLYTYTALPFPVIINCHPNAFTRIVNLYNIYSGPFHVSWNAKANSASVIQLLTVTLMVSYLKILGELSSVFIIFYFFFLCLSSTTSNPPVLFFLCLFCYIYLVIVPFAVFYF